MHLGIIFLKALVGKRPSVKVPWNVSIRLPCQHNTSLIPSPSLPVVCSTLCGCCKRGSRGTVYNWDPMALSVPHRCVCRAARLQHDGALQGMLTIYLVLWFQIKLHGCWARSPPVGCLVLPAKLGAPGLESQKWINIPTKRVRKWAKVRVYGFLRISSDGSGYQTLRFGQMQHFVGNVVWRTVVQGRRGRGKKSEKVLFR